MTELVHLNGITSRLVDTERGQFHVLETGSSDGQPVVCVHGNVSCSTFWEEVMLALPEGYYAIAPDLRGFGDSEQLPVDATRGMRDFSDDIHALVQTLARGPVCLVGHSFGGCVAMQYTIDHPAHVASLSLIATGSPYGFGGTKDVQGTPCWPDYAGSGGGLVHPEVVARLSAGDPNDTSDFAARALLRNRYVKPPFRHTREDMLVAGMLRTSTGESNYSRDMVMSANWPNVAPGTKGANNAISPKYCNVSGIAAIEPKPPVFWIRGADDQIVSDSSASDPGVLGAMGLLPGWPGSDVYPPQPMLGQIRAVFERYQAGGGSFQECVVANVGHMPHIEDIDVFLALWLPFLQK